MSATIKPGISRAKRSVMHSRTPISVLVQRQEARVAKLDERIGALMSKRVDEEQVLAELYELNNARTKEAR